MADQPTTLDIHLRRFLDGDREAFVPLWRELSPRVERILASPLHGLPSLPASTAEELTLEVMEKLYRKIPLSLRAETIRSFWSWVYTLTLNHKRDFLARRRETPFSALPRASAGMPEPPDHADDGAEAAVMHRETQDALRLMLAECTPEEHLLLTLRAVEHYSFEDAALAIAGPPPQTEKFKKQFYRLCETIRRKWEGRFGSNGEDHDEPR